MTEHDDALREAVASAIGEGLFSEYGYCTSQSYLPLADSALAAARPLIEAPLRAAIKSLARSREAVAMELAGEEARTALERSRADRLQAEIERLNTPLRRAHEAAWDYLHRAKPVRDDRDEELGELCSGFLAAYLEALNRKEPT